MALPRPRHQVLAVRTDNGSVRAICSCGWISRLFDSLQESDGSDAIRQATEAGDLHVWDSSMDPT